MMRKISSSGELLALAGQEIGVSGWLLIDQQRIDAFADATGDHQWIHVDSERATRETPEGKTIAHGYLTLSLIPILRSGIFEFGNLRMGINYGLGRVRFITPVPVGSRIRARQWLTSVELVKQDGLKMTSQIKVEIDGQSRPAVTAEIISVLYFS